MSEFNLLTAPGHLVNGIISAFIVYESRTVKRLLFNLIIYKGPFVDVRVGIIAHGAEPADITAVAVQCDAHAMKVLAQLKEMLPVAGRIGNRYDEEQSMAAQAQPAVGNLGKNGKLTLKVFPVSDCRIVLTVYVQANQSGVPLQVLSLTGGREHSAYGGTWESALQGIAPGLVINTAYAENLILKSFIKEEVSQWHRLPDVVRHALVDGNSIVKNLHNQSCLNLLLSNPDFQGYWLQVTVRNQLYIRLLPLHSCNLDLCILFAVTPSIKEQVTASHG